MFKNMKLATKLFGSFVVVLALMGGVGGFAITQLATVNSSTVDLATDWMPSVSNILEAKSSLNHLRVLQYEMVAATDAADLSSIEKEITDTIADMRKSEDEYAKLISTADEKQTFEAYKSVRDAFLADHGKVLDLARQNKDTRRCAS